MKKPGVHIDHRRKKDTLAEALARELKSQYAWQGTFWSVFNVYRESDHGTIPAVNPDKGGGGPASRSTGHIKPTRSDFIADVETAAASVLSKFQYKMFITMSCMKKVPDTVKYLVIAEKCGAEFFRRKISPLAEYFKDVYVVPERSRNAVSN